MMMGFLFLVTYTDDLLVASKMLDTTKVSVTQGLMAKFYSKTHTFYFREWVIDSKTFSW